MLAGIRLCCGFVRLPTHHRGPQTLQPGQPPKSPSAPDKGAEEEPPGAGHRGPAAQAQNPGRRVAVVRRGADGRSDSGTGATLTSAGPPERRDAGDRVLPGPASVRAAPNFPWPLELAAAGAGAQPEGASPQAKWAGTRAPQFPRRRGPRLPSVRSLRVAAAAAAKATAAAALGTATRAAGPGKRRDRMLSSAAPPPPLTAPRAAKIPHIGRRPRPLPVT